MRDFRLAHARLAALIAASTFAQAVYADQFYSSKKIAVLVGFGAGGGYDTNTRLVARHLGSHIPGNPTIVIQNMPGAGSMTVANNIYNVAPKDGTVLGVFSLSVALEPLFGNKAANFDPRKFSWIGSLHKEGWACGVWTATRPEIRTFQDLLDAKSTVVFGSTGPAAPTTSHPMVFKNMFGANARVIIGYAGTKGVNLAMQRGEIHATCGLYETGVQGPYRQDIEAGRLNLFVQLGHEKKPVFRDASLMYERIKDPADRKAADLIFRQSELARPLAAPPGVPGPRIDMLRKALLDTMNDPALKAEAKKMNTEFDPVSGEQTLALVKELMDTPADLVAKALALSKFEQ